MEDIVKNKIDDSFIISVAELLEEHKAQNIVAIDVKEQSSWTDYFIIATVNSQAHMRGLLKHVRFYLDENEIEYKNRQKRIDDCNWLFIDCGSIVIHLMDEEARNFYELEKLWFSSRNLYPSKSSS